VEDGALKITHIRRVQKIKGYEDLILVTTTCPSCKKNDEIVLEVDGLNKMAMGSCTQDAMPYLDDSELQALETGHCYECWRSTFS
jgi:hypothetical protein